MESQIATARHVTDVHSLVADYLEDLVESNRDVIESAQSLAFTTATTGGGGENFGDSLPVNLMHVLQPFQLANAIPSELVDSITKMLSGFECAKDVRVVKDPMFSSSSPSQRAEVYIQYTDDDNPYRKVRPGPLFINVYRPSSAAEAFAIASYREVFGCAPYVFSSASGRVNLIGEHTDYNDGFMLPTATPQKTYMVIGIPEEFIRYGIQQKKKDTTTARVHRVYAHSLGGAMAEFAATTLADANDNLAPPTLPPPPAAGTFASYIYGCIRRLEEEMQLIVPPLNIWVSTELPIGAGLSSSAALEVATLRAIRDLLHLRDGGGEAAQQKEENVREQEPSIGSTSAPPESVVDGGEEGQCLGPQQRKVLDDVTLALLAQQAEVRFAGVRCGVMDQLASSLADTSSMLYLDARTLEHRTAPLPLGSQLVVIDTGFARTLAASKYNERCAECELACKILGVKSLREAGDVILAAGASSSLSPEKQIQSVCAFLHERFMNNPSLVSTGVKDIAEAERVMRRARHVITENLRVTEAASGTVSRERFGELMNASHFSLKDDYEVTVEALDIMSEALRAQPGALGARMTGAGFGGACVALFTEGTAAEGAKGALEAYHKAVGNKGWKGKILVPSSTEK